MQVSASLSIINEIGVLTVGDIESNMREVCEEEKKEGKVEEDVEDCINFLTPIGKSINENKNIYYTLLIISFLSLFTFLYESLPSHNG